MVLYTWRRKLEQLVGRAGLVIERLRGRIPAGAAGEISSQELTFCVLTFIRCLSPPLLPVLPQWHVKDPGHSANSAGGSLHLNTHIPLTQRCRSRLTVLVSSHSVGTYHETSSHATRSGNTRPSLLSSLSHCGLILAQWVELVCAN